MRRTQRRVGEPEARRGTTEHPGIRANANGALLIVGMLVVADSCRRNARMNAPLRLFNVSTESVGRLAPLSSRDRSNYSRARVKRGTGGVTVPTRRCSKRIVREVANSRRNSLLRTRAQGIED